MAIGDYGEWNCVYQYGANRNFKARDGSSSTSVLEVPSIMEQKGESNRPELQSVPQVQRIPQFQGTLKFVSVVRTNGITKPA